MKIAVPFPQAFELMKSIASCKVFTWQQINTGPKIYSLYTVILLVTLSIIVGATKLP